MNTNLELVSKKIGELREIATQLGVVDAEIMKKDELIAAISNGKEEDSPNVSEASSTIRQKRKRISSG